MWVGVHGVSDFLSRARGFFFFGGRRIIFIEKSEKVRKSEVSDIPSFIQPLERVVAKSKKMDIKNPQLKTHKNSQRKKKTQNVQFALLVDFQYGFRGG